MDVVYFCVSCFLILIMFVYMTNQIKILTEKVHSIEDRTEQVKEKIDGLKEHSDYLVGIMNDHIDEKGVEKITFGR